jgi:hypothetical protein
MGSKRVNVRAILADADLRRKLMVSTIQATQAREGIETSPAQADRAYYVVTEAERAAFFELTPFRAPIDLREEAFVRAISGVEQSVRIDSARRDFAAIEGAPLAYRQLSLIAHLFREHAALEPAFGRARIGGYTGNDEQYVRMWWETPTLDSGSFRWEPYAKGGEFSRFYADVYLKIHWDRARRTYAGFSGRAGRPSTLPDSVDDYFKSGLTWPRRTQRGFNLRFLPEGCVFSNKGPVIIPQREGDAWFLLGIGNSAVAEAILRALISFGSWEAGAVRRLPVARASLIQRERIANLAKSIHDAKREWDSGNEISTSFDRPWLVRCSGAKALSDALDGILDAEVKAEKQIQSVYGELNTEAYKLYAIPEVTRTLIEKTLGERPPEVIWQPMEGTTVDQRRMEHVWRLLSYAVKRVIEADEYGIVPFNRSTGETPLGERVRQELTALFPEREESQLEVEIVNELKRNVKGYRKCTSLDDWLANAYFDYHASLYKSRPIFWHIASAQGTTPFAFGALVHYHRFDKNRMAKLRASYVRDTIEELRRDTGLADKAGRTDERTELQAQLEEVQALDKKLQQIQEGHHEGPEGGERDFRILTPWKEPSARPHGWAPDLDDGVKVNIAPLDRAGVLRVAGVAE